jgi:hypothetical protein
MVKRYNSKFIIMNIHDGHVFKFQHHGCLFLIDIFINYKLGFLCDINVVCMQFNLKLFHFFVFGVLFGSFYLYSVGNS